MRKYHLPQLILSWYQSKILEFMAKDDGATVEKDKMVAIDLASPYYLHPSDHPDMTICPVILKGDNFQEWEKSIRKAFRATRKLSFLDDMVQKPDDDESEIED